MPGLDIPGFGIDPRHPFFLGNGIDHRDGILRKQAQRGPATEKIPFIGPITFSVSDIDALYRHIKGA